MCDHVNIGAANAGPMGVVAFWDAVYLPFIESADNLKPATIHCYKPVWNQHLKSHFGSVNLSDYKTHMMSGFLTGLAKDAQAAHVKRHQMAGLCDLRSRGCFRPLRNKPHQRCEGTRQDVGPQSH
jgi:hypothetical protein